MKKIIKNTEKPVVLKKKISWKQQKYGCSAARGYLETPTVNQGGIGALGLYRILVWIKSNIRKKNHSQGEWGSSKQ